MLCRTGWENKLKLKRIEMLWKMLDDPSKNERPGVVTVFSSFHHPSLMQSTLRKSEWIWYSVCVPRLFTGEMANQYDKRGHSVRDKIKAQILLESQNDLWRTDIWTRSWKNKRLWMEKVKRYFPKKGTWAYKGHKRKSHILEMVNIERVMAWGWRWGREFLERMSSMFHSHEGTVWMILLCVVQCTAYTPEHGGPGANVSELSKVTS